jgi:hypothetical protein
MLMFSTPYSTKVTQNPLFIRDTRRAKWAWPREQLLSRTIRLTLLTHLGMILLWVLLSMLWYANIMHNSYYSYMAQQAYYNGSGNAISMLLIGIILAGFALDLGSIQSSLNSINGEVTAGRWDLLRLTALSERGIINAKYSVAQLRAWRSTLRLISARVALVLILVFYLLVMPIFIYGYSTTARGLVDSLTYDPVSTLLGLVVFALISIVFVIEPLWRMKAMTALGLVISSYVQTPAFTALAGIGAVLAIWIAQLVIVIALIAGSTFFVSTLFFAAYYGSAATYFVYLLLMGVVTTLTIYGFYYLLQTWSLRRATLRIVKSN